MVNASIKEQQDSAAGGEKMRKIKLPDGSEATASLSIQVLPAGYQKWGYLRFKKFGKTHNLYVGKVSADTPEESLVLGWKMAREKRVIERSGLTWVFSEEKNQTN